MNTVLIKDQTIGGSGINQIDLQFDDEVITIKDLIIGRVKKEVEIYNSQKSKPFTGLVTPNKIEQFLNKKSQARNKSVDFEKQSYVALDGFTKNQFFIIINNNQAETLDEEINLSKIKEVEFIKLMPLVGG